jgi:hypothetical protein
MVGEGWRARGTHSRHAKLVRTCCMLREVRGERCETSSSKGLWVSWQVIVKVTVRQ